MKKVTVHRFRRYDILTDQQPSPLRWVTEAGAAHHAVEILPGTAIEVDEADVGAEELGMTNRGFVPRA